MKRFFYFTILTLLFITVCSTSQAQEIQLPYNNLTLIGNLEMAPQHKLSDGVILMTHAGLGHSAMETMASLQSLFREQGYTSLAITLSLNIDKRHGMFDCKSTHRHLYADATKEIDAWVSWLEQQAVHNIILFGHSRGGSQTAYYAAEHDQPDIKAVVLLAPDTRETNSAQVYQRRYHKSLQKVLSQAQALIKAKQGDSVMQHTDFLYCPDTSVTAATFDSYYGSDPHLDSSLMIRKIVKPTLIMLAGQDSIVINNDKLRELAGLKNVHVNEVEDANHFFRDLNADEAVEKIIRFLRKINE